MILALQVYQWTDSLTVLQWRNATPKKQQVFVAHRSGEVPDCSSVDEWRHVEDKMNPCDFDTRVMTVSKVIGSEWLTGPACLHQRQDIASAFQAGEGT